MLVQGNYDNTTPTSDGGIHIPDGDYMARCRKEESKANSKGNPQSVLTMEFFNASDFPKDKDGNSTFKPNMTRNVYLQIPAPDAKDDDFTKQNFLKAVMAFYMVEEAQAKSMLRSGVDTASFQGRQVYVNLNTALKKEKDKDGNEKEVSNQNTRFISLNAYTERKGSAPAGGGTTGGQANNAGTANVNVDAAAAAAFAASQQQSQQQTQTTTATLDPAVIAKLAGINPGLIQQAINSVGKGAAGFDPAVMGALSSDPATMALYMKAVTG